MHSEISPHTIQRDKRCQVVRNRGFSSRSLLS
jgi:hypothetical protein